VPNSTVSGLLYVGIPVVSSATAAVIAHKLGRRAALSDIQNEALVTRYESLVAPLRALLIDTQVATYCMGLPLTGRQRRKEAWKRLRERRVWSAIRALFQEVQYDRPRPGIEYGAPFPLGQVGALIRAHPSSAGPKLFSLLADAERSRGEYPQADEEELTREEFALHVHICRLHDKLHRLLFPSDT